MRSSGRPRLAHRRRITEWRGPQTTPKSTRGPWQRPAAPPSPSIAKTHIAPGGAQDVCGAVVRAAAIPGDNHPPQLYLAGRLVWPPDGIGPGLPASVRWLPRGAVGKAENPHPKGRPKTGKFRRGPPADAVRALHPARATGQRQSVVPEMPPVPQEGPLTRPGATNAGSYPRANTYTPLRPNTYIFEKTFDQTPIHSCS